MGKTKNLRFSEDFTSPISARDSCTYPAGWTGEVPAKIAAKAIKGGFAVDLEDQADAGVDVDSGDANQSIELGSYRLNERDGGWWEITGPDSFSEKLQGEEKAKSRFTELLATEASAAILAENEQLKARVAELEDMVDKATDPGSAEQGGEGRAPA